MPFQQISMSLQKTGIPFQQMHAEQYALLANACRAAYPFSRCMQFSMPFQQISIPFQQMRADQYTFSADQKPFQQIHAGQHAFSADQCALSTDACGSVCPFSRYMQISMPFQQMHVNY